MNMKNIVKYITIVSCVLWSMNSAAQLPMQGWKLHTAYNNVTRVEMSEDKVFGLSEGALFAVDKEDLSMSYYNRLTGLSGTNIADIYYDDAHNTLIIAYVNGYVDLLQNNEVTTVPDLYNAALTLSKEVNNIYVYGERAYLSMDFGIVVLNLRRHEVADTYYIGENAAQMEIRGTTIMGDTIYAATDSTIYTASLKDNLVDYSYWKERKNLPAKGAIQQITTYNDELCLTIDSALYCWNQTGWTRPVLGTSKIQRMRVSGGKLLALCKEGTWMIDQDGINLHQIFFRAPDAVYDNATNTGWYAYQTNGIGCFKFQTSELSSYLPSGPLTNTAYRMRFNGERLYIVPGGYAGVPYLRDGAFMIYENNQWMNFETGSLREAIGFNRLIDFCDIIGSPTDPNHFYVASYGNGVLEFKDNKFHQWYYSINSPLNNLIPGQEQTYTRVDAFAFDSKGNLWMQDNSTSGIKILTPDGKWIALSNAAGQRHSRMKNLIIDNQRENIKYVFSCYQSAGIGILDDNGTLEYEGDDKAVYVNGWIDDDGKSVTPNYMWCAAQDHNGVLWAGTEAGVLKFTSPRDLLHSNRCSRIKIPRNDGSGLADYLLGEEMISAIAVDGANRIWFGTESSGAYLMDLSDPQDIVTVHHYTQENSPLPSNNILSIAINPVTGEVFFGTGGGLVSYQSDAAEGKEDYSSAYAYPNPVRENFDGVITIVGLMRDTQVRITDNGGNLVYETKSNGGIAVWDGKNGKGERVSSGVYFAMCVTEDGTNKTLVKILVMN